MHVDYFAYEHMNNIIKQVALSQNNSQVYVEHDKSNMLQFLNIPLNVYKKTFQKLKSKKAAGVDAISA